MMGEHAEMILDGIFDQYTGEYLGPDNSFGFSRSKAYKKALNKIRSIRKEIALDIKAGTTVNEARRKANLKYGKGWRNKGLVE
jgi:GTP cyclohydrolase III